MLNTLRESVSEELADTLSLIESSTNSTIPLVSAIQSYALKQPGRKLVRPTILLLLAKSLSYHGKDHIVLAAIIEMIHSATLLHDDIIDNATTRRNKLSAYKVFGTTQSILMGDFIYACAFKLIAQLESTYITNILAKTTQEIVEGELFQHNQQGKADMSIDDYCKIIRAKTALLFSTGAHCISHVAETKTLDAYGYHFGMLYQMTDDILDIDTRNLKLNKAHGTDLREGKMTLPTILAYQNCTETDKRTITRILKQDQPWQDIIPILDRTNALALCHPYLMEHLKGGQQALSELPDSFYKTQLLQLLHEIPNRKR